MRHRIHIRASVRAKHALLKTSILWTKRTRALVVALGGNEMSYKLELGVAIAAAALALPGLAAAQDPSTRTDLTIIGAVSADKLEQVADTNAAPVGEAPVIYEDATASDAAETASADESAADSSADLSDAVESE
jgi:hypothetical protein